MAATTALVHVQRRCRAHCSRCGCEVRLADDHHVCPDVVRTGAFSATLAAARLVIEGTDPGDAELQAAWAELDTADKANLGGLVLALAAAQCDPVDLEAVAAVLRHADQGMLAQALEAA